MNDKSMNSRADIMKIDFLIMFINGGIYEDDARSENIMSQG